MAIQRQDVIIPNLLAACLQVSKNKLSMNGSQYRKYFNNMQFVDNILTTPHELMND